eukprot:3035821-Alexandrium_andersonii.AAC.1
MSASLVGSEMCIRDRYRKVLHTLLGSQEQLAHIPTCTAHAQMHAQDSSCLLYTSDAADDM